MAFNGEIFEVFSWLSAKSIFKFAYVCKACNTFLAEDLFIKRQCQNMLSHKEFGFFIQPNSCRRYGDKLEFHMLGEGEEHCCGVPPQSLEFINHTGRLLTSCNGLLYCKNINNMPTEFFICNPATQKWLSLPTPDSLTGASSLLGIVFQSNNSLSDIFSYNHLLFSIEVTEHWSESIISKVYVLHEGVWKERGLINCGPRNINFDSPAYGHGTLHFLSSWFPCYTRNSRFYWPYIVAYNLESGASRFLKVPKDARRGLSDQSCKMSVFEWKKRNTICLVKLLKNVFTIWVLSDYNSARWSKLLKVRSRAMGMIEHNPKVAGFTVLGSHSLLVATDTRVYQYELADNWRARREKRLCRHGCGDNVLLHSYSSTLRSCGDRSTPLPD